MAAELEAVWVAPVFSLVGVVLSGCVGFFAAKVALKNNDKTVFVSSVTAERSVWRSEIRAATSSLASMLRTLGDGTSVEWPLLYKEISELYLRLNPAGRISAEPAQADKHKRDRDVHSVLADILGSPRTPQPIHRDLAARLEEAVAGLLKQEWTVSKAEALSGKLKDSRAA